MARDEVVDGAEDRDDDEDQHRRVRPVSHLAAPHALRDLVPAEEDVGQDEGPPRDEVEVGLAGQRAAGPLPGRGPDDDDEAEGSEEVDRPPHHALHRWLCTDSWARNSPKAMKLR